MCLAILAIDVKTDWPLIVVANRDEYHDRAAAPLKPWHNIRMCWLDKTFKLVALGWASQIAVDFLC